MRQSREILRLHFESHLVPRQIATICKVSKSTVQRYLERLKSADLGWPLPADLDDVALERRLFPPPPVASPEERCLPDCAAIHKELKSRKNVTLQLLWEEYKQANPLGYAYSWYCELYREWQRRLDVVLRHEHRAGEKTFVDYAGQTVPVIDPKTGEVRQAQVFVAVLGELHALRLTGMAEAYQRQLEEPEARGLNFEERFGMLVDCHWTWRENQALMRRLKKSKLSSEPCVEDIDYRYPRQMDPATVRGLTNSQWVIQHLNVLFTGPTGIGKTWLGQALAQKACRDGYSVLYRSAAKLFRDLAQARADGSLGRLLESIARTDVLLVDDFAMAALSDDERRSFLEVCDDRYGRRSTVLTSQLPVESWHAQIGDPTIADSILDRLVHNAIRIEMNGESIRKNKKKAAQELIGGRS